MPRIYPLYTFLGISGVGGRGRWVGIEQYINNYNRSFKRI